MKRMKKALALLLSLSLLLGVGSLTAFADPSPCEVVAFEEDFTNAPSGWTFADVDGDGYQWFYQTNPDHYPHSGVGMLQSESYSFDEFIPLSPDNWAFTPPIAVPDEAILSFWVCEQDSAYWPSLVEEFEVYIFAAADPNASELPTGDYATFMTKIAEGQTEGSRNYVEFNADLSDYAGQTVYLAFRHLGSYDQYRLNLDDVTVKGFSHTYGTEGDEFYTCSICGEENETRKILALAVPVSAQDPTCTEDGNIACYTYDGKYYQINEETGSVIELTLEDVTIPALNHPETETVIYPATCTESGSEDVVCKLCGETLEQTPIEPLGHDDGLWQVDFEATPEHDGQMTCYCTRCGELLETETFAPHTHETGFERVLTPATCTEDGEKGLYCAHCNALYDVEAIPATGHDDGVWKVDFEPTADHDGQKTLYCTKCGAALDQETFSAHDHTLGYEVTLTPATCTVDGEKGLVCADCGAVYATEAIPAAGHVDGVERTLTPATCTADGEKATCCDVCGEIIKTEAIPATGHTPGAACILTPTTCTGDGEKGVYCDTCGEVIEVEAIPAAGHDEGVWKVDFEPTPEHDGQKTRYCTKCGAALETETFSAHTHTLGYETVTRKATCTKDGEKGLVCATCGVVYATEVIPAKGHTEGYQRIVTPATCTEPGVMGTFCATCGQRYAVTEIAATGHAFGAWYQNGDGTHSRDCTRCQLKETANCKYTATVTEPTCTEEGFTTYVCDDCGYTYVDDHVDPLGHDWSAWTDDENDETHSHVCARCGETETEAHNFGPWVFNDDASFFKNGTKTRTCGDCGCAETEEAAHTSTIARILLPPILWLLSLVRKVVFTGSFLWYLPWLNLFPKM
ncbi:MAG: choice-of-anchor J domain-containing protein [Clostridia bacterium]|nr:choice-of-anchor J domain-containing protein [Clostridia bacterium]